MSKLNIEVLEKKQKGPDTFLSLHLSEKPEDEEKTLTFEMTFHNVKSEDVDVRGGIQVITKEGAPVILSIGKPIENPLT